MRLVLRICCVVLFGSFALTADVDAMYGKTNGGISYAVAKKMEPSSEAYKKALEADHFAEKISALNPHMFNAIPIGMSAGEFVYELLNWHSNKQVEIDEELRHNVMSIGTIKETTGEILGKVNVKFVLAKKMLSEAKIIDQRITKKAVSEVLEKLSQLDNEAKKLLDQLRADVTNGSISEKIENYATQFQKIYENSSVDFNAILSQKYAEVPGSLRLAEPNSETHLAVKDSITSKRAIFNALLEYIKSLTRKPLRSAETQTDLTGEGIDRRREEAERQNVGNQEIIAQQQTTIYRLESELTELRNGLHMASTNFAVLGTDNERYKRDLKFKDRLTGLLLRAQVGFDYRTPSITRDTYRNTIIRTATGKGAVTHLNGAWFKQELWKDANRLVVECLGLLASIGFLKNEEIQTCKTDLREKIQQLCQLLPSQKGKNLEHPKICLDDDTKIKVGRSLDRALETIQAYIDGAENPPEDPFETLDSKGKIVVTTHQPLQ